MKFAAESALAKIRRQRKGEAKATEQYEVKDENAEIYATVTEEDYQKLKERRRAQHWVEGEGYSDDGEEWWESDSGGEDSQSGDDSSEKDEETVDGLSRKQGAASRKRKTVSTYSHQEEDKNAGTVRLTGKRAKKAGGGGGAAEGQGNVLRMRSLVQHFTARSAERAAIQQQQRLNERDAESLKNLDKLLDEEDEEEEEEEGKGYTGTGGMVSEGILRAQDLPRRAREEQRERNRCPSRSNDGHDSTEEETLTTDTTYSSQFSSSSCSSTTTAKSLVASGERVSVFTAGHHDRKKTRVSSHQSAATKISSFQNGDDVQWDNTLDVEPTQALHMIGSTKNYNTEKSSNYTRRKVNTYGGTSFLEQLGLGSSCNIHPEDHSYPTDNAPGGEFLSASPQGFTGEKKITMSSSNNKDDCANQCVSEITKKSHVEEVLQKNRERMICRDSDIHEKKTPGDVGERCERRVNSERVGDADILSEENMNADTDRRVKDIISSGGKESEKNALEATEGKEESIFQSTGEFEQHGKPEISLLKHAQPDFFIWTKDEEEEEGKDREQERATCLSAGTTLDHKRINKTPAILSYAEGVTTQTHHTGPITSTTACFEKKNELHNKHNMGRTGMRHTEIKGEKRNSHTPETVTGIHENNSSRNHMSQTSGDQLPHCKDGSLPFYLLDAHEEEGILFLFGKVWALAAETADGVTTTNTYKNKEKSRFSGLPPRSCCVIVRDMMVPLFFRTREQVSFDTHGSPEKISTTVTTTPASNSFSSSSSACGENMNSPSFSSSFPVSGEEIKSHQMNESLLQRKRNSSPSSDPRITDRTAVSLIPQNEEEMLRQRLRHRLDITRSFFMKDAQRLKNKYHWKKIAVKGVFRHYAFDAVNIPREKNQTFVKMYVPAPIRSGSSTSSSVLGPEDYEGETYTHVFGIRPSLIELLLVKRQIKGPCWLRIQNYTPVASPLDRLSWCQYEVIVHSHKAICCWDYTFQIPEISPSTAPMKISSSASSFQKEETLVPSGKKMTSTEMNPSHNSSPPSSDTDKRGKSASNQIQDVVNSNAEETRISHQHNKTTVHPIPPPRPPPLTVISICLRTIQMPVSGSVNPSALSGNKPNTRYDRIPPEKQLAIAAFFVYRNADVDDQTAAAPQLTPQTVFCAVRRMRHNMRGGMQSLSGSASTNSSNTSSFSSSSSVVQYTPRVLAEGVPLRFPEVCTKQGFTLFDSERHLLLGFVNQIAVNDPDILIGHDVYSHTLDVLAQRLVAYGLPAWHRLSRLKRGKHQLKMLRSLFFQQRNHNHHSHPTTDHHLLTGGNTGFLWGGRLLTIGRLVCDTYLQSRELLSHRVDYDLLNLIQSLFFPQGFISSSLSTVSSPVSNGKTQISSTSSMHGKAMKSPATDQQQRLEAAVKGLRMFPQEKEFFDCFHRKEYQPLLACLHLTLQEAYITLLLCWRLNCLPLTRELTSIGGNLWNRSLQNQRAERNTFLLLHEFHKEKYICPDPLVSASAAATALANRHKRQLRQQHQQSPESISHSKGTANTTSAQLSSSGNNSPPPSNVSTRKNTSEGKQQHQGCLSSKEEGNVDMHGRTTDPNNENGGNLHKEESGFLDDETLQEGKEEVLGADTSLLAEDPDIWDIETETIDSTCKGNGNKKNNTSTTYTGGLVLEPRVGYFETFVLLLDFNSLYPSIIQEFNVCFSTLKRSGPQDGNTYNSNIHSITSEGKDDANNKEITSYEDGQHVAIMSGERKIDIRGKPVAEGGHNANFDPNYTFSDQCEDSSFSRTIQNVYSSTMPGILPRILRQLVQRRRAVKTSMKTEGNPLRRAALDIKQLALKLTANSIYGCLGFSHSRFYARDLAAFITQQGRNVLLATKEKVERILKLEVLYGDTDSLMINTGLRDDGGIGKTYAQAVRLGEQVKSEINKSYRRLEIDLEAVFHRLLLLRKKKYACCIVVDYAKKQFRLEQKGLDFVRRDWAKLTRVVGQQLLEILFSTNSSSSSSSTSSSSSFSRQQSALVPCKGGNSRMQHEQQAQQQYQHHQQQLLQQQEGQQQTQIDQQEQRQQQQVHEQQQQEKQVKHAPQQQQQVHHQQESVEQQGREQHCLPQQQHLSKGDDQKGKEQHLYEEQEKMKKLISEETEEETVDVIVERLHAKLEEVSHQLREKKVPLEYFVITKALTRMPQMYPRAAGGAVIHPHVQVALRMQSNGISVKPGSEIPFVICTAESAYAFLYASKHEEGKKTKHLSSTSPISSSSSGSPTCSSKADGSTLQHSDARKEEKKSDMDAGSKMCNSNSNNSSKDDKSTSRNPSNTSNSSRSSHSSSVHTLHDACISERQSTDALLKKRDSQIENNERRERRSEALIEQKNTDRSTGMNHPIIKNVITGEGNVKESCINTTERNPNNKEEKWIDIEKKEKCFSSSSLTTAERAFHPREVLDHSLLQIDIEYYIEQQLFPPILRLCAHVQGTSSARLAECLGLDPSKHTRNSEASSVVNSAKDDMEDDIHHSKEDRERAGEEQILALLARTDEKYKRHPLPIHLRCESCRRRIAGKDVLRYMRCPTCLWWISPSILNNFLTFTLAALQRRYTKAIMRNTSNVFECCFAASSTQTNVQTQPSDMSVLRILGAAYVSDCDFRCTACDEHYAGLPAPPAAAPPRQRIALGGDGGWQQQYGRAAAVSGFAVRCPRCEEGRLREDMNSYDMYIYLDELLFYLSGDVTSQQRRLADKFSSEEKQIAQVWKDLHNNTNNNNNLSTRSNGGISSLAGSSPRRGDDTWLVPVALDANFRVRILPEGEGLIKPPPSYSLARQGMMTTTENKEEDLLDELYTRVIQQNVNVKRGAQLRYPGLTAAVTYWKKSSKGMGWIDMQHERNKLRAIVTEVMEQNPYRMLKLSSLYNVMKPPAVLDPTKRRWRVVQKLNLLKQTEAARSGWNEELRCRAPAVLATLRAITQNAHGCDSPMQKAAFGGFACFAASS